MSYLVVDMVDISIVIRKKEAPSLRVADTAAWNFLRRGMLGWTLIAFLVPPCYRETKFRNSSDRV